MSDYIIDYQPDYGPAGL